MGERSSEAYSIEAGRPVITRDLARASRLGHGLTLEPATYQMLVGKEIKG
jgi:hypothetical protein